MAPKSLVLAALLIAFVVVSAGQLPRGSAGLGASPNANTSILVSGIVPCATGNSINLATALPFPNAMVQLVCGSNVVGTTTTDSTGAFLLHLVFSTTSQSTASTDMIAAIMHGACNMVVPTPLGACDKSLAGATGTLTAPLRILGITTGSGINLGDLGGLGGLVSGIVIGLVNSIIGQILGGILNLGTMPFSFV